MANFGEMATVGAAVKEDCDFGKVSLGVASPRMTMFMGFLFRSLNVELYLEPPRILKNHRACVFFFTMFCFFCKV